MLERSDIVADSVQLNAFLRHFGSSTGAFGSVISTAEDIEEMRLFRQAPPGARLKSNGDGEDRLCILRERPKPGDGVWEEEGVTTQ